MNSPTTVPAWLAQVAEARGDAPALVGVDQPNLSYRQLAEQVRVIGGRLRLSGIVPGDVVLIALPDGPEALVAILATASVATAFPVGPSDAPETYESLFAAVGARAIICNARLGLRLASAAAAHQVAVLRLTAESAGPAGIFNLDSPPLNEMVTRTGRNSVIEPKLADPAVLISTSGSTAAPKFVSVSHASLFASITQFADWLSLSSADRSLCVMPMMHLHSLLRSTLPGLISGGAVICAPGFNTGEVLGWIDRLRPTYMTAAPSIYRQLMRLVGLTGLSAKGNSFRVLVTGSDNIDAATLRDVETAFGAPVWQFYVLSETAPLLAMTPRDGIVGPPGAAGRVNPLWSVTSVDENGVSQSAGVEGEIAVRGGFINPLVLRSNAPLQRLTAEGRLLTGDLGVVDENGFLFVTGRIGDRIHRGGEKISPQAVEEILLEHPAVARATAFGIPDPVLGQRVAAAVVLVKDHSISVADLQMFVARRAAAYMVPEKLVFLDDFPTNSVGKVSRAGLAKALGFVDDSKTEIAAGSVANTEPKMVPTIDIEGSLMELFRRSLKLGEVDVRAGFFDIGGDSFAAIGLLIEVEDLFGVRVPPAIFASHSSVVLLAEFIRGATAKPVSSRMQPLRADGRFPPLFVAYNVEGNVGYGAAIVGATGPELPLYALNTLGSKNDAAEPETLEEQAGPLIDCIQSIQPRGPYHLLGYSFGSHLALEMAQQICDRGESVAFLGVIDDSADLGRRQFGTERAPPAKPTTLTANRWAIQRYVPKPYPGRITLFRANEPTEIYQTDPYAGWSDLALGGSRDPRHCR